MKIFKSLVFVVFAVLVFTACDDKNGYVSQKIKGDEVLIDTNNKIAWVNGSEGCKTYVANKDDMKTKFSKTPAEAVEYCENLEYAGNSDWRLPTAAELSRLTLDVQKADIKLNYAFDKCKRMVASGDKFVQTEKSDDPGAVLDEAAGGAGIRCVTSH